MQVPVEIIVSQVPVLISAPKLSYCYSVLPRFQVHSRVSVMFPLMFLAHPHFRVQLLTLHPCHGTVLTEPAPFSKAPLCSPSQRLHLRITSTLYVALISPTLLNTRQVYFPLSSGFRFFRFNVHFFFLFSPISWGVRGLLSFSHVMSGLGLPLATHLRRMELPTGRAITLRLILAG